MISTTKASLVAAICLVLGFVSGWLWTANVPVAVPNSQVMSEKPATASIMIDFGDGTIKTFRNLELQPNENLLSLLKRTAEANTVGFESKTYEGLGTLVIQIGSKKNGEKNNYWQYWVNNEKVQVGAADYVVKGGDVIEWKFAGDTGN